MEREAMEYIDRIDELGGIVSAIETGFPQKEIADAAYRYQQQLEDSSKVVVGVNKHQMEEKSKPDTLRIGPEVEEEQLDRLKRLKSSRDQAAVEGCLSALAAAAEGDDNLLPLILAAVREYATVGEVSEALVPVFGRYREVSFI